MIVPANVGTHTAESIRRGALVDVLRNPMVCGYGSRIALANARLSGTTAPNGRRRG